MNLQKFTYCALKMHWNASYFVVFVYTIQIGKERIQLFRIFLSRFFGKRELNEIETLIWYTVQEKAFDSATFEDVKWVLS